MITAQRLADEKWERESSHHLHGNMTQIPVEPLPMSSQLSEPNIVSDGFSSSLDPEEVPTSGGGGGFFSGWFGPTAEQRRAQREFEKWQASFKERIPEGGVSLPSSWLPSAGACLLILGTLCMHALFHLLCHWLVSFHALALFRPATRPEPGCHVLVFPPANRGKAELVPLTRAAIAGILQISFQRQTYIYTPAGRLGSEGAKKYPNGWRKHSPCTSRPLIDLLSPIQVSSHCTRLL